MRLTGITKSPKRLSMMEDDLDGSCRLGKLKLIGKRRHAPSALWTFPAFTVQMHLSEDILMLTGRRDQSRLPVHV